MIIDEYSIHGCLPGWSLHQTLINYADAGGSINGIHQVGLLYLSVTVLLRDHVSSYLLWPWRPLLFLLDSTIGGPEAMVPPLSLQPLPIVY